jgi:hypothetical protein
MSLVTLGVVFWTFAIVSIILRAVAEDRIRKEMVVVVKMIPALTGVVLALTIPVGISLYHYLLATSLVFCALGDVGMEYNIRPGLGMFLIAQILFVINFLQLTLTLGLTYQAGTIFLALLGMILVYVFFYTGYLQAGETPMEKNMLKAVTAYAFVISLTLSSSILLAATVPWLSFGWILPLGAALFVVSDSVIGVSVFHHHMRGEGVIILTTYYLAIFFIALSAILYVP